ncbi:MAG: response regulator [Nitrospirae bacterium]|nr:response regulator [Nitrospirota bacterium]
MAEKKKGKKSILIVDDSSALRNHLKKILEGLGFEVAGMAENGIMAITKYKETKPDIVMIDMIMPQLGGLECLRLLKQVDPAVAAIMVSSVSSQETVLSCLKEGAKHYILKPYDEEKIKQVMETFS